MHHQRIPHLIPLIFSLILIVGVSLFLSARKTSAQCGSQASSCKNCHETQGNGPVNNDGTTWHTSHSFGDFCYICHAGNNQAMDKDESHTGMVAPLADIEASCMQCHPNDMQELAQVYAVTLGVEVGSGTPPETGQTTIAVTESSSTEAVPNIPSETELDVDDPNLVDYTQRYNEIVLGKKPINWGNLILVGMIGLVAIGGGGYVLWQEKLIKVSFGNTKPLEAEYPADVVDMLPVISRLNSASRKTLSGLLKNPQKVVKVLGLIEAVISDEKDEEEA